MHTVVRFGKLLTDPLNLRILNLLRQGELCLCEIEASVGGGPQIVRNRLDKLQRAGFVRTRRRSLWAAYAIAFKYSDLVETVFEAFDEDLGGDDPSLQDEERLRETMRKRVDGWCEDTRFDADSRQKRASKPTP